MLARQLLRRAPRGLASPARQFSLDFQPIDFTVDPLDETARSALAKSCYVRIDWKINQGKTVHEAIKVMSANNIGALGVSDEKGEVVGIISERDYLNKVGLVGKTSRDTLIKEIATMGKANLVSVTLDNPIDACERKMINSNVRHLLVREKDSGKFVGMISVKDIVKCAIAKHDAVVQQLTGFIVNSEQMRRDV